MKKVIIIGCSGAGKSTFARKLRDATGMPLHYLDMIWHRPDRSTVSREEFDTSLADILIQDSWIIDGNYARTLEVRLAACDTVFFFDFPVEECLAGVKQRRGTVREDMPWVELKPDEDFLEWIREFPNHTLPRVYELLDKYGGDGKEIHIFRSRQEANDFIKRNNFTIINIDKLEDNKL